MSINSLEAAIQHEEEMVAYYEQMAELAPNKRARSIAEALAQNKRNYVEILKKQALATSEQGKVGQENGENE